VNSYQNTLCINKVFNFAHPAITQPRRDLAAMVAPSVFGRVTNRCIRNAGGHRQRGFSLLEMAMVVFMMSLLYGGTLGGTALINSGQVKALAGDFQNASLMLNSYQDTFRAQPGDDRMAPAHLMANAQPGNGDGVIDGKWNDTGATSEASRLWQHLRLAGLNSGATDSSATDYSPVNALGHTLGIQAGTRNPTQSPISNLQGGAIPGDKIVCSRRIPGKLVLPLDLALDDGNPATGFMLATLDTGAAYASGGAAATLGTGSSSDIQPEQPYIVCMGI
jgi:prepilin-type N-terminal cleavage/methylation domain-containing protein